MNEHPHTAPEPQTENSESDARIATTTLNALWAAWKSAAIYDANNTAYRQRRSTLMDALHQAWEQLGAVEIGFQNGYFFVGGRRLDYSDDFAMGRELADRFIGLHIGRLTVPVGTPEPEVDRILATLAHADSRVEDPFGKLAAEWERNVDPTCTIERLAPEDIDTLARRRPDGRDAAGDVDVRRRRARSLFKRSTHVMGELWQRVRDRNSFDVTSTQRVVQQMIDQLVADEAMLMEFAALKDFDEYTYYHSVTVAIYSIATGMRLGLDRQQLAQLGLAALFHDIGKVKLPQDLISKPDEFDDDDWEQIKRHPALGALTIAGIHDMDDQTVRAMASAYEHHMKIDLSGYPPTNPHREMSLYSRIISVCDSYDAMTSGRVYLKIAVSPDEAMRRLLYQQGSWYDSRILKAFVNVVGVFPVGTIVRLEDDRIGIVTKNDPDDLYAPEILVVRATDGTPIREPMNLARNTAQEAPEDDQPFIREALEEPDVDFDAADYLGLPENLPEVELSGTTTAD